MFTLLLAFTARVKAQTYQPIIYPGSTETIARGINSLGQIVGEWIDTSGAVHGFIYNAGTYTSFDYPGASGTSLYGINNAGDIVGYHDFLVGFFYKGGTFTTTTGPGFAVNNFDFIADGSFGFLSTPSGQPTAIQYPGSSFTSSLGISDAFQIVGYYDDQAQVQHGFSFNFTNYTTIDVPGHSLTTWSGINTLGEIVGTANDTMGQIHGFLDSGGIFTQLDYPSSPDYTYAYQINDFGQVVGKTQGQFGQPTRIGFLRLPAARNPTPFINQPLVPNTRLPGGGAFTLTVEGTGFVSGAVVNWNGSARTTTFQNSGKLTAAISASDVAAVGTASVTVVNPAPGGGRSNPRLFQITNPVPTPTFSLSGLSAGSSPQRVIAADFNGDGITDLAATDSPNNRVIVIVGNGDGTFQSPVPYQVGAGPSSLVAADFDADGKLDIAVADYNDGGIYMLQGNGDGTFHVDPIISIAGSGPWDLGVGDFNGDGRLDLACVNQLGNTISILLGNGDATFNGEGSFQPRADFPTNPAPGQVTVGDFNGDGILDLAVANFGSFGGNTVSVFLGNGNGTLNPKVDYTVSGAPLSVVAGDFNGDGKLDLAVADSCGSSSPCGRPGEVSILLGNGDGTFQTHVDYPAGWFPYTIVAGDFNGDGKLDVAISDLDSSQVTILSGVGDGTFTISTTLSTIGQPVGLLAADFNGDGLMDLAVGTGSIINIMLQNVPLQPIASLSLSPTSVLGGTSVTGTVTLSGPAPSGGATIALSSSNTAAATVQGTVTVPAGATSATFSVVSLPVAADTSVTISATYGSSSKTAALTVQAPTLLSLTLNPTALIGGNNSVASATLNGLAPSSGLTVALSSSDPSIASPGNIAIAGGSSSGTASITTQGVASKTLVKILATLGAVTKGTTLTVKPAALLSVKMSPTSLYGGGTSTATVSLNGEAPPAGAVITLASSDTSVASLPATVTIPGGTTSAPVTVQTQPVIPTTTVTISAAYDGLTRTAKITVKAAVLFAITLNPTTVNGGSTSTATVTLSSPAPPGGAVVALASSNTSVATVPPSVTVPAGATTVTATVATSFVFPAKTVHIAANYAGLTKTAALTVR
jgi:hypothetical protein